MARKVTDCNVVRKVIECNVVRKVTDCDIVRKVTECNMFSPSTTMLRWSREAVKALPNLRALSQPRAPARCQLLLSSEPVQ